MRTSESAVRIRWRSSGYGDDDPRLCFVRLDACVACVVVLCLLCASLSPAVEQVVHMTPRVQQPPVPLRPPPRRRHEPLGRGTTVAVAAPQLLLVLGVMCTEHRHDRRAWLRQHYHRHRHTAVEVRFFVDAGWLSNRSRAGIHDEDDVVGVAHELEGTRVCGGWGSDDAPGSCATREARVMAKARGWWRVAARWRARFVGKTDDDCVVDVGRLATLLAAVPGADGTAPPGVATHDTLDTHGGARAIYGGKIHFTSINGTAADQLSSMPCYSNHGAASALGTRYFASCRLQRLRGPFPFASGPLILLSEPARAWLLRRSSVPLHSAEASAQVEDAQLGWELSHHPALDVLDLAFAMRRTNVRRDFADPEWRGFDGIVAHKVDTAADMRRVAAVLDMRLDKATSGGQHDYQGGHEQGHEQGHELCASLRSGEERARRCPGGSARLVCLPWLAQLGALDAFPCCRRWNVCVPPAQAAATERAQAAAAAEKQRLPPRRAEAAARWLGEARVGYCGVTSGDGDCARGAQGSFEGVASGEALDWELLVGRCLERCARCERCRYISASLAWRDCSWFASCAIGNLSADVPGFRSAPANMGRGTRRLSLA